MPQYELMYILAATVSDEQVPEVTSQVQKFISDFGGTNITENILGKKKLAYPIKKTRNGFYVVVDFQMDSLKINEFDAKIRTQNNTIIRYLITNTNEHHARLEKDRVNQASLQKQDAQQTETVTTETEVENTQNQEEQPVANLDAQIDAALTEDVTKN